MEVIYGKNAMTNGQFLSVKKTQSRPDVIIKKDPSKIYTLIIHDPNAVGGNKIHWARINITNNDINTGLDIIPYKGPAPPLNTGMHHYRFELYEQNKTHDISPIKERAFKMNQIRNILKVKSPISRIYFKSCREGNITKKKHSNKFNKTKRNI